MQYAEQQRQDKLRAEKELSEVRAQLAISRRKRERLYATNELLNSTIHHIQGPSATAPASSATPTSDLVTTNTNMTSLPANPTTTLPPPAQTKAAENLPETEESSPAGPTPVSRPDVIPTSGNAQPETPARLAQPCGTPSLLQTARDIVTHQAEQSLTAPLADQLNTPESHLDIILQVLTDPAFEKFDMSLDPHTTALARASVSSAPPASQQLVIVEDAPPVTSAPSSATTTSPVFNVVASGSRLFISSDDEGDDDLYAPVHDSTAPPVVKQEPADDDVTATADTSQDHFAFLDKLDLVTLDAAADIRNPPVTDTRRRSRRLHDKMTSSASDGANNRDTPSSPLTSPPLSSHALSLAPVAVVAAAAANMTSTASTATAKMTTTTTSTVASARPVPLSFKPPYSKQAIETYKQIDNCLKKRFYKKDVVRNHMVTVRDFADLRHYMLFDMLMPPLPPADTPAPFAHTRRGRKNKLLRRFWIRLDRATALQYIDVRLFGTSNIRYRQRTHAELCHHQTRQSPVLSRVLRLLRPTALR